MPDGLKQAHGHFVLLLQYVSQHVFLRYPPVPALEPGLPETSPDLPLADSGNSTEDSYESVPFPPDMSMEKTTPDSKALVAVPAMSVEALAVVPLHGKSRRSELVQRRIRRPFSVSEVEALVQAVEKLGTGRYVPCIPSPIWTFFPFSFAAHN